MEGSTNSKSQVRGQCSVHKIGPMDTVVHQKQIAIETQFLTHHWKRPLIISWLHKCLESVCLTLPSMNYWSHYRFYIGINSYKGLEFRLDSLNIGKKGWQSCTIRPQWLSYKQLLQMQQSYIIFWPEKGDVHKPLAMLCYQLISTT